MSVLAAGVSALSTFYQDSLDPRDPEQVEISTRRLLAKLPVLAAYAYKTSLGQALLYPDNSLSTVENFLRLTFGTMAEDYVQNPIVTRALETLLILHADHEQNCSTSTVRLVGSAQANLFASVSSGINALFGPLHGGANEAVVRMLTEIGDVKNIPAFIESVKRGEGRLMGFGHRVYKNFDPRATIIKKSAYEVFEVTGTNPLLEVALKLEEVALNDEYFASRKLYPNVDFYSGLIYQALGFPVDMFTVLFAIPRTVGWLAHMSELLRDDEQKISRPRQWYTGVDERNYTDIKKR
jgi:citrate synthase